jgi:hypothetical protein
MHNVRAMPYLQSFLAGWCGLRPQQPRKLHEESFLQNWQAGCVRAVLQRGDNFKNRTYFN